jgi:hypothetical protein
MIYQIPMVTEPSDLVVVTTCPRPKAVSYLSDTLKLLDAAGASEVDRMVVSDGPIDRSSVESGWNLIERPGPSGTRNAFWGMLGAVLKERPRLDRLLVFEDDVSPCKNAITRALKTEIPSRCAFVSFFDMRELPKGSPDGLHVLSCMGGDLRGFWGFQSVMFRPEVVRYLAASNPLSVAKGSTANDRFHNDVAVARLLFKSPWTKVAVHVPCLVEHRGDVSAWGDFNNSSRIMKSIRATNFRGEDFNALSLGRPVIIDR